MKDINIKNEKKKVKGFLAEFKKFIKRGNVIDLAVGVIIGSSFGKIVSSLVDNILMPFIGLLIGGKDFTKYSFKIKDSTILYGSFIQNIVDFLIVAFCIFIFVKIINNFFGKEEKSNTPPPKKTDEILLLEEIRDILKKGN